MAAVVVLVTLVAVFCHLFQLGNSPPVPYFDPAYNGLDALRILRRGVLPIFFPANGGREPLLIYLQALAMGTLGVNSFALRLPGALAGILAVPALFGFTRCLMRSEERSLVQWTTAWAALGLALSTWFVSQNRLGVRAALLPLLSIGVMWLLVEGWRRYNPAMLAAAGGLLGLSAYTYTAARFLPFVLVLVILPEAFTKSHAGTAGRAKRRWVGFGLLIGTAVVVFAPLGLYYLGHTASFAERAGSVMVWNVMQQVMLPGLARELGLNLGRTAGWFARLPVPIFIGLVIGLGVCLVRLNKLEYRLVVIWWFIMLLPSILTIENPHPMRSLGAAPATYVLVALGLATLAGRLTHHWRQASKYMLAAGLLVVTLSCFMPLWAYFHPEPDSDSARIEALSETIIDRAATGAVYLPLSSYHNPSLRFVLADTFQRRADWSKIELTRPSVLVEPDTFSQPHLMVRFSLNGDVTLLPPAAQEWLELRPQAALEGGTISIVNRYETSVGSVIQLPWWADPGLFLVQPETRLCQDSGGCPGMQGVADLAGFTLQTPNQDSALPVLTPGGPLWVTTYWQALGEAKKDYDMTVYLLDDRGQRWGQADGPPTEGTYPTSMWRKGEKVPDSRLVWVDPKSPPGRYWLDVAFYDYTSDSRLPVSGSALPDTLRLGPLKIRLEPSSEIPSEVGLSRATRLGDVAKLLDYQASREATSLNVSLYWQSETPDGADYTVFVHLLNDRGEVVSGHDSQPVNGTYPTGIWEPGEIVVDTHGLDVDGLEPGTYHLEVGMYVQSTGLRLPMLLPDGTTDPGGGLILDETIEIL